MPTLSPRLLALIPVSVAINLAIGRLVNEIGLPVYLDSIGTVLASGLAGPLAGVAVGLISQLVAAMLSGYQWLAFAPIQVMIALLAAVAAVRGDFGSLGRGLGWGLLTGLLCGMVSSVIAYLVLKGVTAPGVTALTTLFRGAGIPLSTAVFISSVSTDVVDKAVTFVIAGTTLRSLPVRMASRYTWALRAVKR